MILIGLLCLILGFVLHIYVLWVIGLVLLILGVVLLVLGRAGPVGGRWY